MEGRVILPSEREAEMCVVVPFSALQRSEVSFMF